MRKIFFGKPSIYENTIPALIDCDLESLIEQLQRGETPGNRIPGTQAIVYKVRIKSSDQGKGKRGGFRVIYYLKTVNLAALLSIYAKTERANLSAERIRQMIDELEPPPE